MKAISILVMLDKQKLLRVYFSNLKNFRKTKIKVAKVYEVILKIILRQM